MSTHDNDEVPDDHVQAYQAFLSNDPMQLHAVLEPYLEEGKVDATAIESILSFNYSYEDVEGSMMHLSSYFSKKRFLKYFLAADGEETQHSNASDPNSPNATEVSAAQSNSGAPLTTTLWACGDEAVRNFLMTEAKLVVLSLLRFQRYAALMHILRLQGDLVSCVDSNMNTILHIVCLRRRPNVDFLSLFLKKFSSKINIEALNGDGYTALQLLSLHCYGVTGKHAARLLLKFGASVETQSKDGRTVVSMAVNPYVRECVGLKASTSRAIPPIDDKSKEEIDKAADVSQLPPLKIIGLEEKGGKIQRATAASPSSDNYDEPESPTNDKKSGKKQKKLNPEAVEGLVTRLYIQATQKKERWFQDKFSKLEEETKSRSKKLSLEEQEEALNRLYTQEMDTREERHANVSSKYIHDPPEPPKLEPADLEESTTRLCKRSLEQKQQAYAKLLEKYSPPRERKRLTKEELKNSAVRLHDEWEAQTNAKFTALYKQYMTLEKGRFNGGKRMTNDDWRAMGDRLCSQPKR